MNEDREFIERIQIGDNGNNERLAKHIITKHKIDIDVDSPYARIKQQILFEPTLSEQIDEVPMETNSNTNAPDSSPPTVFLHRFDNSMALRSGKATISKNYDKSKLWSQRDERNDILLETTMKPTHEANVDFHESGTARRVMLNTMDDRKLHVVEIYLGRIQENDAVLIELDIDAKMNNWSGYKYADLFIPLQLPTDKAELMPNNPGGSSLPGPIPDALKTEIIVKRSNRPGAAEIERVEDMNQNEVLRVEDRLFLDERQTPVNDLKLRFHFAESNQRDKHHIISQEQGHYQVKPTFVGDCVKHTRFRSQVDHEVYLVSADFILPRDLKVRSKFENPYLCYNFVIDVCVSSFFEKPYLFNRMKDDIKAAIKCLANQQRRSKFNIYVTKDKNNPNGLQFSLSGFMNQEVGMNFDLANQQHIEYAEKFIDQLELVKASSKFLRPTLEWALVEGQDDCNKKEQFDEGYTRQVILISDCGYNDFDKATQLADRRVTTRRNPHIASNRIFVVTVGDGASVERARSLSDTTYGVHRHASLQRLGQGQLEQALNDVLEIASICPPVLNAQVKFEVRDQTGRELAPFFFTQEQLDNLARIDKSKWMSHIHKIADGKTRRVSNSWRQIKYGPPDWIHDQFEPMHMETNTFQRILLVKEKPASVAATLFIDGEVQHQTWTSDLTPRRPGNNGNQERADNGLSVARACYRERIHQLERHYRVNHESHNLELPPEQRLTRAQIIEQQAERGAIIIAASMMTGVASSLVAFIGIDKKARPFNHTNREQIQNRAVELYPNDQMDNVHNPDFMNTEGTIMAYLHTSNDMNM